MQYQRMALNANAVLLNQYSKEAAVKTSACREGIPKKHPNKAGMILLMYTILRQHPTSYITYVPSTKQAAQSTIGKWHEMLFR